MVAIQPSVSHYLTADHSRLDVLFDDARRLAAANSLVAARAAFSEFANGLARHIDVEERILFPALDTRGGLREPTMVMLYEHRVLDELVERARQALRDGDLPAFARHAARLGSALHAHNIKEERVLYPRTDAALSSAERAELIAALRRG